MQRHSSWRISVITLAVLISVVVAVGFLVRPAPLVAQTAALSGSSSIITKDVLESPCEKGYVYEIQSAPKDSKEPFVIKRSLNPKDPEKRWSGSVRYRRPPATPGGKATIMDMGCSDRVVDMIKITRDVTNLGTGPKVSYSDFAVDVPLDSRGTDQITSAFNPTNQNNTPAATTPPEGGETTPGSGNPPVAVQSPPAINRDIFVQQNQITAPSENPSGASVECPTCGTDLRSPEGGTAEPPAAAPSSESVNDLNTRISTIANTTLTKNPDVAALGGVDVVKACVAAQNCDEVAPKPKGVENLFKVESDVNEKYTKIVTDATYGAIKAQPKIGYVERPNQEIATSHLNIKTDSAWSGGGGEMWVKTAFDLTDPDRPAFMWTDKVQPNNKTPSDIVVYKADGSAVPVRVNGDLVNPGGFVSQVDGRIKTESTFDTFFSAMVGTNKSAADKANFTLEDPSSPIGDRTVKVSTGAGVQLSTLPEKAYAALQTWGDRVYENDPDQLKQITGGKLSFAPSVAFPKDVGLDAPINRVAPVAFLSPLTPDKRHEMQERILWAAQRYTPEYWANVPGVNTVISDFGIIGDSSQVKAGALTTFYPGGGQGIWFNGYSSRDWTIGSFNHEILHLAEGRSGTNSSYPSDREWGIAMYGEQYGRVYAAQSGIDFMTSAADSEGGPCTQDNRPGGFPSCYSFTGGPMEHKADMQKCIMGNYSLCEQESQRDPQFRKGFDLIAQSIFRTSNGTMTREYLGSLSPVPTYALPRLNMPLTTRIDMLLRSLRRR